MFLSSFAFVAGIRSLYGFPGLPATYWFVIFIVVAAAVLKLAPRWRMVAWYFIGLAYAGGHTHFTQQRMSVDLLGRDVVVSGTVASIPQHNDRRTRFTLEMTHLSLFESEGSALEGSALNGRNGTTIQSGEAIHARDTTGLLRLNWYGDRPANLRYGRKLTVVVKLREPRGFANPGAFDYERWLFTQRIIATGYVRDRLFDVQHALNESAASQRQLRSTLANLRDQLRTRLRLATHDLTSRGLILALAMGDRSEISSAQWQTYLDTGTNHLLAISGLHIGLVAGFVGLLAAFWWRHSRWLRQSVNRLFFATGVGLLAAGCYAAMAGFALPTQRALIMLSVLAVTLLGARHARRSHGFALALMAVCVWDPLATLSPGFWLSFAAVAVLMLVFGGSYKRGKWAAVRGFLRSHLLINIGLAPLTLLLFSRVSVIAPLANLIAVPAVATLVTPVVFVATILSVFSISAARWLFVLVNYLLTGLGSVLGWLASWPFAVFKAASLSATGLVFASIAVILLLLPQYWRVRWLIWPLILPMLWSGPRSLPAMGEFELTFLDVGQGTAVVVRTHSKVLVYDTGPRFSASFDAASAAILPFLGYLGHSRVDRLVVSHPDRDHSGGAPRLSDEMSVQSVYGSASFTGLVGELQQCRAGFGWRWDEVEFRFVHPSEDFTGSENNRSCVLQIVAAGGQRALLAGDIELEAERHLLAAGISEHDVLLAPHHGSNSSSSVELLDAVKPKIVVYTTGFGNRYGFPQSAVRDRYLRLGSQEFDTGSDGAVTVSSSAGGLVTSRYREQHQRIWSARGSALVAPTN